MVSKKVYIYGVFYGLCSRGCCLSNNEKVVLELIIGHFEIERCRALPDASRGVVVRSVARAVVATEITSVGNWHTAQMCADSDDDQVLGVFDTVSVGLGISQRGWVHSFLAGDLSRSSVPDEKWLSPPLENGSLSLGDLVEVDLDLGQGEYVGRGAHAVDEGVDHVGRGVSSHHT